MKAKYIRTDEELTAGITILSTAISYLTIFVGIFVIKNPGRI
jgi:predicted permease